MNDKQIRRALASLRDEWRMWETGRGLHIDYTLLPGTDEGDCATAYRADHLREIELRAAALKRGRSA